MGFGKYVVELLYELLSNSPLSCTFDFNEPRLQKLVLSLFVLYLTGENLFEVIRKSGQTLVIRMNIISFGSYFS